MDRKKLIVGAAVAVLVLGGGGAAIAAQQAQEENIKGGTITAPAGSGEENEAVENEKAENEENEAEGKGLEGLARIDKAAAENAALGAVPGEVKETELENENGFVVYEVEVAGKDGKLHEVVVDAGNGKVLAQETE
jgi:uncharacterized membrane protein YkoI